MVIAMFSQITKLPNYQITRLFNFFLVPLFFGRYFKIPDYKCTLRSIKGGVDFSLSVPIVTVAVDIVIQQ